MSTYSLSDAAAGAPLDLTTPAISSELTVLEERLHVVQGLLDALARLHEVNKIVQFSRDRDAALAALQQEPFRYSRAQADAVLDMPVSWQTSDEAERLRSERNQLTARQASLHEHVTEALSLHWFG
jgi:DNA gyrase/topoisomerase IV subunit A